MDAQYFNNTLGTLRGILKRAGIVGIDDPTKDVKRLGVKPTELNLPEPQQFEQMLEKIDTSGHFRDQHSAEMAQTVTFTQAQSQTSAQLGDAVETFRRQ